ncbi:hypothetical protein [Nocardia farcinica]|uniref:hypothetical protein n=1 Tax=Nocardia farcinica TaxID=37329 RepID=UPI000A362364|nr:hypothetical protein [Nocardia farcinica]UAK33265.1 hypothetical protein K8O92_04555 [Nocardia asteroides]MBF6072802.1 hypothetical protein [Nocardia farcinica]MBF6234558.1 hypothetical protein [Nocardia farcinica]MBF6256434.1 hypothetical protein [Nocardia farcinica]MBF6445635.1 hypothetical protein [Nocardia farcinica]
MLTGVVVNDLDPECLVQVTLQDIGGPGEMQRQPGQVVQESGFVGALPGDLFTQRLQLGILGPAFLFEFCVAASQPFGPGLGQLVVAGDGTRFQLGEHVVLSSGDVGEGLLDRGGPLFDVVALARGLPA